MNISQSVERAAKFFPDKSAIVFEGTRISYADLNARVNRLANALNANKVGRGACVALYLPNIPEFAICYLSAVRVGAIAEIYRQRFRVRLNIYDGGFAAQHPIE